MVQVKFNQVTKAWTLQMYYIVYVYTKAGHPWIVKRILSLFFISGYKRYEETFEKQDQWLSKLAWWNFKTMLRIKL